jgi:poly(hydroxyalkanoate) granule-associated protein
MVKKLQKTASKKQSALPLAGSVKESAQQIWLAGLGAFAKAQSESGKAFETLVKEGLAIQRKTQAVAEEKISEATSKMADMASGLSSKATGITSMATGQWDKLENIFELRVAKALSKLGVPSSKEVADLVARIDELNKSVQKLSKAAAAKPTTKVEKPAAEKPQAKPKAAVKAPAKAANGAAKPAAKRAVARKTAEVAATV